MISTKVKFLLENGHDIINHDYLMSCLDITLRLLKKLLGSLQIPIRASREAQVDDFANEIWEILFYRSYKIYIISQEEKYVH